MYNWNNFRLFVTVLIGSFVIGHSVKAQEYGLGWVNHLQSNANMDITNVTMDKNGDFICVGITDESTNLNMQDTTVLLSATDPGNLDEVFILKFSSKGEFIWVKQITMWMSSTYVKGEVTTDNDGNVIVVGRFRDTVDFNPGAGVEERIAMGGRDVYILKLNGQGDFMWVKTIESNVSLAAYATAVDANDNIFLSGSFRVKADFDPGVGVNELDAAGNLDLFLLKLNSNGEFSWVKQFESKGVTSSTSSWETNLALDNSGNIFVSGPFQDTLDVDPGPGVVNLVNVGTEMDAFFVKLDSLGTYQWGHSLNSASDVEILDIAVDNTGGAYTTGYFMGTTDFDPGVGTNNITSVGEEDIFIQKISPSGTNSWVHTFGKTNGDEGSGVYVSGNGDVFATGYFKGKVDFDPAAPFTDLNSHEHDDAYVLQLTSTGDYVWAGNFGSTGWTRGLSILEDGSGNIYSVGEFNPNSDFHPGETEEIFSTSGYYDLYLHKLVPCTSSTPTIDTVFACRSYSWIDGEIYNESNNTAVHYVSNSGGCDSMVSLNLTISNLSGDVNCNAVIEEGELLGDKNGNGVIDGNEILGDANGNGVIDGNEVQNDGNNDGVPDNVGMSSSILPKVNVYPNPAYQKMNIELNGVEGISKIQIMDLVGSVIMEKTANGNTQMDVSALSRGVYILEVDHYGEIYRTRFIKQ